MSTENKIYESYGRFALQFERACSALEVLIKKILEIEGLKSEEIKDILLAENTAEPLKSLAHSLICEHLKPEGEEEKIIGSIFGQFQALISERNDLIHSSLFTWSIQHGEEHTSYATGQKLHKNKKGVSNKKKAYTSNDIDSIYEKSKSIFFNICRLRNCIEEKQLLKTFFVKKGKVYELRDNA